METETAVKTEKVPLSVQQLKHVVTMIQRENKKKCCCERKIWLGIINLIERSDFGKISASVRVNIPLETDQDCFDVILSDGFKEILCCIDEFCSQTLGRNGSIEVEPFTAGIGTRSFSLTFKPSTAVN